MSERSIPKAVALQLCEEIRKENRGRWYSWKAWWCWGCETFCEGDPEKMCLSNRSGYRGCMQINARMVSIYSREAGRN